jgi:CubicO group peptidase (beta-lactamase class C family)
MLKRQHQTKNVDKKNSLLLENILHRLMKIKGVRHALVAVESLDRSFRWAGSEGIANENGTPFNTATPFWIASITKLYIACVILKLHESGVISIENKVSGYLKADLLKGLHVVKDVDYYDKLTIRHLLSHSSGIPDYIELKTEGGKTLIDRVLENIDTTWTLEDILRIVRKTNDPLFAPQLDNNSKYRIRYSDTNFQILIAVIESVTKKPVEKVYRDLIFKQLNLNNTFLPGSNALKPAADVWLQDIALTKNSGALRSFGDLYSTADDLIEFMRALINGSIFEKPETRNLMQANWNRFGIALSPISPGWPIEYGLGMMRFRIPRLFTPFRPMPEIIGHTGAVGSWLFYCPELDMIMTGTVSQARRAAVPFKVMPELLQLLKDVQQ